MMPTAPIGLDRDDGSHRPRARTIDSSEHREHISYTVLWPRRNPHTNDPVAMGLAITLVVS